jgi:hypothetical protein
MQVVLLAPDAKLGRLRPHVGADRLVEVNTLDEFLGALRAGGTRRAIIDPMCVSAEAFHGLISAAGKAGAAVLLYSRLQGFDHERLTRAYGDSVPDVVFAETDDDWVRVRNAMRVEAGSVLGRLLRALYPRIRMFPVGVARQTAQLFAWGPVPATVAAFSRKTGEQTATVRRVFARNGLMPPHIVLVAARLARAWYELPECDGAFALLAERHGFGSLRSLERWCRESLESTPRRVAIEYGRDTCYERLLNFIQSRQVRPNATDGEFAGRA